MFCTICINLIVEGYLELMIQHTHSLFALRECISRLFLSQPPFKHSVMESIKDVLFSWAMAAETESLAISNELLWHVVELWLTIWLQEHVINNATLSPQREVSLSQTGCTFMSAVSPLWAC